MSAQLNTTWLSFGSYNKRLLNRIAAHNSNYWIGFISDPLNGFGFPFLGRGRVERQYFRLDRHLYAGPFELDSF